MMDANPRSAQVIAAYRQHKLSVSALSHIRQLLQQFERERQFDRVAARYGLAIIVAVLAFAAINWLSAGQVTICR